MNCRSCGNRHLQRFLDLGFAPPSNAYLTEEELYRPEITYPLRLLVCDKCWLVQTEDYAGASELFTSEYAYFSSTSSSWLAHASDYCRMIANKLRLNEKSLVIEVASNDGYLLRNFKKMGIPCLGIEPTDSTADAAEALGISVLREFFGQKIAERLQAKGKQADLIIGNNVYAHVPDIRDFTTGLKTALKPNGTVTLEFPHLLNLIRYNQFDTVYHEHYSYLSLHTVRRIFESAGLKIIDVERLTTHGGSLRIYGAHYDDARQPTTCVADLLKEEVEAGLLELDTYLGFQIRAEKVKDDFLAFLLEQKRRGRKVAAYGAAAKGNTLLNFAGIKPDLLPFVCDAAPAKQGKYLPGSHIPVQPPEVLADERPDYVVILPWNIADEIMRQNDCVQDWGAKFVTFVPKLRVDE